jgi:hypothetical protein
MTGVTAISIPISIGLADLLRESASGNSLDGYLMRLLRAKELKKSVVDLS